MTQNNREKDPTISSHKLKVTTKFFVALLIMTSMIVCLPEFQRAAPFFKRASEKASDLQKDAEVQVLAGDDASDISVQIETDLKLNSGEPPAIEDNKSIINEEEGTDLSNNPEYIAELKKIYSEEDLTRMNAPRQWVSMPNVVGMKEAEALSTLNALGLVGRVIYLDGGELEGVCYAQDITAGQKWNTDASLFIWVHRKNEVKIEPLNNDEEETTLINEHSS